ncbi:hypothetical protein FA13DRAFT_1743172 [Coprinellus micaceus]|uniref:F-box domain-containing protein n=1 Tax=Coprinellus micaceus TaxID=71717 RepID=A0A4Y7SF77_COPMI|nr:hypothetical protein FA13DRAFT_1743172 [Coprinellus micaceus]
MSALVEGTLPAELRSAIVSLCSQKVLPSLALVNREFQLLAEKSLYSAIVIRTFNKQIGSLETLSESPSRALFVKFLSVEFYRQDKGSDVAVIEWLIKALPFMRNLKDFRIKMRHDLKSYVDDLNDALCAGYFQLITLFVEYYFDLPRIAEKHKGLDILATYGADGPEMPFALSSSSRDQPLIAVGLNRIGNRSFYNRLVMVPELLSVDQARDFDVLLQSYFETDAMQSVKTVIDRVVDVCIYLRGAPLQDAFSTFMRCIARAFTGICEVELHVKSGLLRREWCLGDVTDWPLAGYEIWNWNVEDEEGVESNRMFVGSRADLTDWIRV